MMKEEEEKPQHISELINKFKPQLRSFSRFYNDLPDFMEKDKDTQQEMLLDLYITHSQVEQLLRTIIDEDINAKTYDNKS